MSAPVPAETIEKAARAAHDVDAPGCVLTWDVCHMAEDYRASTRAAIAAVRDDLVADALAPIRALVSDWQANGNSRELGDPTASTWQEAATQLLDRLPAPVQAAEDPS